MDKKPQIFIHIGVAKAASTTLQKQLFDRHSQINNLGVYPTRNLGTDSSKINYDCAFLKYDDLQKFHHNLVVLDEIEYRSSDNFNLYQKSIAPLIETNKINVISNERFTSWLFSHGDVKSKANRLKAIFPEAKIVMIIRNQFNAIVSQYRDWPFDPREVIIGEPVSLDKWVKLALEDDFVKYFSTLKYYEMVDIYSKIFGKENVGLFLFEELIGDISSFTSKLSNFLQIHFEETRDLLADRHENRSVSHRYNIYRMLCRKKILPNLNSNKLKFIPNGLKHEILLFLKQGNKKEYRFDSCIKQEITNYFAVSNANLQNIYNLDLGKYEYPLEKDE